MKKQVKVLEHSRYRGTEVIQSVTLLHFCYRISMVFFEGGKSNRLNITPLYSTHCHTEV